MVEVERLSRFRQRGDGGLQISGLVPDDTGMFQCFARNAAGEVQTSTYLAVTSKLVLPLHPSPPGPRFPPSQQPLEKRHGIEQAEDAPKTVPQQPGWLLPATPPVFTAQVWCSRTLSQGRLRWLFERSSRETTVPALASGLPPASRLWHLSGSLPSQAGLKPPHPNGEDLLTSPGGAQA